MASLEIEGDINGISNVQIDFIREVLAKRGYTNNKVIFEPTGKAGDNYAANVKRISVINDDGEEFKMIAKFAPEFQALRMAINTAVLFINETFMYGEVLPKFVSLQKAAGVPETDILKYAKCYGCLTEEPHEVILLEDLKELDFVMLDRFTSLSDEVVRLILKNFAILHSLSYALKKLEPDTYEAYRTKLIDMWSLMVTNDEFKMFFNKLGDEVRNVVDNQYKDICGVLSQMPDFSIKMKKAEKNSRYLVIQQGDAWTNNILLKLENDRPSDCIMIDYQISREASPVADILYMIFNCTDHSTREKHYHDWIDFYHDELDASLSHFGIKTNYVYPRDQLDADLKRYSKVYLGTSVMLSSILCRKPEEAKAVQDAMKDYDIENMENLGLDSLSDDTVLIFKTRVEDLIKSFRLFGYL